jgi:inorganic pyrophosphatase/exopolyphosphatase
MTVCVVGHSSPDTDSVTSAIAYAALLNAQGTEASAWPPRKKSPTQPENNLPSLISVISPKDRQISARPMLLPSSIIIKSVM